jgi:hypothetical protein
LQFLEKRITDEIFYEIKDLKNHPDLSSEINKEVIFHYLAKAGDTLVLYETKQTFIISKSDPFNNEIVNSIQKIFIQINPSLKLIKGKIREIFLSYSH